MKPETLESRQTHKKMRELLTLLRALEYPRMLSLQSFKLPNFKLTAEVLFWLCGKIQQDHQISSNINRENERVAFVRNVCQLFSDKFRVTVSPLKLYTSDYRAIDQLLILGLYSLC